MIRKEPVRISTVANKRLTFSITSGNLLISDNLRSLYSKAHQDIEAKHAPKARKSTITGFSFREVLSTKENSSVGNKIKLLGLLIPTVSPLEIYLISSDSFCFPPGITICFNR